MYSSRAALSSYSNLDSWVLSFINWKENAEMNYLMVKLAFYSEITLLMSRDLLLKKIF